MLTTYTTYKDSGVEWVGEIPSHWDSTPLKRLVRIGNGKDYKHIEVEDGGYPVYGTGGVFSRCSEYLHTGPSVLLGRKGTIDNPLFVNEPFWTSDTIYFTIIDESKILPLLLFRLVHQIPFDLFSYGSTIPSMTKSDYEEMKFPLPPLSEQQQIVSFLDTKTSLVDSLIEKTQRKIELLKEKRTSLINEVVTKGLNPNVEMKDSGVEWIGEIPSHWGFVKVGHYTHVVRGGSPRPSGDPKFFNGDFIHWITVKDITSKSDKYVVSTEKKLTEEGMKQSRVLEPETLVLTNSGVTLGIPGILKIKGCINDGSVGFLNVSHKVERDYLYYFWTTQTKLLLEQQSGYGQPNLNIEIVSNVRFPLPPLTEQQEIVEYLDEQIQKIHKTISIEEKRIELLKEYRQSLISEVVTGKRKVVK